MATYIYQVSTASATAAGDLGMAQFGIAATGDISTRTAVTNLTWAAAAYDASGRSFIVGSVRTSASHIPGTTHGILNVGIMASALPFSGVALGTGRYYPLTFDTNGAVWVTPSGNITVSAYLQSSGNSIGSVVISGTAFIATATLTGLSAVYVTASGQVSAIQSTSPWVVSANNTLTVAAHAVTAFISAGSGLTATAYVSGQVSAVQTTSPWVVSASNTLTVAAHNVTAFISAGSGLTATVSGNVSATQVTSPWVVSANNLLTVSAGVTGGSLGVTGGSLSAVTAYLASSVQAFTSGSATAAAQQGFIGWALVDSAGTSGVNPSIDGKHGWHTVNASGHTYVKVTGTALVSATNLLTVSAGVTGGSLGVTGGVITASVSGQGAHNAATAGNPLRTSLHALGFNTTATGTTATASANNAVNWYGTTMGNAFVIGGAPNADFMWIEVSGANSSSNAKLVDVAAGTKIIVTEAGATLGANCSVNVAFRLALASASGATTLDAVATGTGNIPTVTPFILQHSSCPPGGGIVRGNGGGIIAVGGDGCDLMGTWGAPTGGKLSMWVQYFKVPA